MKKSVSIEVEWIQTKAFELLEGILSQPVYVIGAKVLDNKRLKIMLQALSPLHAIIIQSIQLGNIKRAARYLLLLKELCNQMEESKALLQTMVTDNIMDHAGSNILCNEMNTSTATADR